jgi:hypothetical protein
VYLIDQHFERGQLWKIPAVEHEIIYTKFYEWTRLFYQLLRRTDETKVLVILSAPTIFDKGSRLRLC